MTLSQLREAKHLSRATVARRMGMTYHNILRLESEGTTLVTTLEAYADAMGAHFVAVWEASRETRGLPAEDDSCEATPTP